MTLHAGRLRRRRIAPELPDPAGEATEAGRVPGEDKRADGDRVVVGSVEEDVRPLAPLGHPVVKPGEAPVRPDEHNEVALCELYGGKRSRESAIDLGAAVARITNCDRRTRLRHELGRDDSCGDEPADELGGRRRQ
jgi:hypothetical protein